MTTAHLRARSARYRTLVAACLTASVALAACSTPAAQDSEAPASPSADVSAATSVPAPLDVRVSVDSARSKSAVVGPEGGEVTTTSADGTTFTLGIPADALTGEHEITLTPIESIAEYPFAKPPTAGVHMEPEGLRFFAPATLRIEDASDVDADEIVGFGYLGTGADFHLVPVAATSSGFAVAVFHFSGVGVGAATDSEVATQQQSTPADPEARLHQALAAVMLRDRQCLFIGLCEDEASGGGGVDSTVTEEESARIGDLVGEWEEAVKEMAEAGRTNCETHTRAAGVLTAYERQWATLGAEGNSELHGAVADALDAGARNCIRESYEKCRADHDLGQVQAMQNISRQAELIGDSESELVAFAEAAGSKCATFELEYEGAVATQPHFPHYRYGVRATVPLIPSETSSSTPGNVTLSGSAPLEITDWYDWAEDPCAPTTVSAAVGEQPFEVREVKPTWTKAATPNSKPITAFELTVDPGSVQQTATARCGDGADVVEAGPFYRLAFLHLHGAAVTGGPVKVKFASSDILGGELYARRTYQVSTNYPDGTLSGDFVYSLWHRPPPLDEVIDP